MMSTVKRTVGWNGSTVRMIIHSEKLEIATLYGKPEEKIAEMERLSDELNRMEGGSK